MQSWGTYTREEGSLDDAEEEPDGDESLAVGNTACGS